MNAILKNEPVKSFRIDRRSIINEIHAAFAAEVCGAAELAPGTVLYTDSGLMNLTNHEEWSSWKMMTWNADEETTESRKGFSIGYYKFYVKSCSTIYAFNHVNDRFFRTIVDHLRESGDSHFILSTATQSKGDLCALN